MEHTMKLQSKYFYLIKDNIKTYEVRLYDDKRKQIKINDIITFSEEPSLTNKIKTQVVDLIYFKNFDEMAEHLPAKVIGFNDKTKNEIVETYHQFYSKEDEIKFGVIAIKVKLID